MRKIHHNYLHQHICSWCVRVAEFPPFESEFSPIEIPCLPSSCPVRLLTSRWWCTCQIQEACQKRHSLPCKERGDATFKKLLANCSSFIWNSWDRISGLEFLLLKYSEFWLVVVQKKAYHLPPRPGTIVPHARRRQSQQLEGRTNRSPTGFFFLGGGNAPGSALLEQEEGGDKVPV